MVAGGGCRSVRVSSPHRNQHQDAAAPVPRCRGRRHPRQHPHHPAPVRSHRRGLPLTVHEQMHAQVRTKNINIVSSQQKYFIQTINIFSHFCSVGAADVDARVDPNSIASGLLETYNVVSIDSVDILDVLYAVLYVSR